MQTMENSRRTGKSQKAGVGFAVWVAAVLSLALIVSAGAAERGVITGTVVDSQTGELLIGATVMLEGTSLGAKTNLNGIYMIRDVPPGLYAVQITSLGYSTARVEDVMLDRAPVTINLGLVQKVMETEKVVTVKGEAVSGTDAALLKNRQASNAVSDAISAQTIARSGGGNAAQVLSRVTGASTDGRFVFVRGLGDRYTNTQLNGTQLPSPDPDKQAVPLDLMPTELLDNIIVTKSFTPDMPGNFSGGSINLVTKDFPDGRLLTFSTGTSYSSEASFKEILSGKTSSTDWLGTDDGQREIPAILDNPNNLARMPKGNTLVRDPGQAQFLSTASQSFSNEWVPRQRAAPLNQNYAVQYGDNLQFFGRRLGVVGSLSYARSYRSYDGGDYALYIAANDKVLQLIDTYTDARSIGEVLWGGLASLAYDLGTNHTVRVNYIQNRSGESEARTLVGRSVENDDGRLSRNLTYTERNLRCLQVKGSHQINPMRLEWRVGDSRTRQDQPDMRQSQISFDLDTTYADDGTMLTDTSWGIGSGYRWPARFWRELTEDNREYSVSGGFSLPRSIRLKLGWEYLEKAREQRQTQFNLAGGDDSYLDVVDGNLDQFVDTAGYYQLYGSTYVFPLYYVNGTQLRDQFDGSQRVVAGFAMLETPVVGDLMFVGGIRYETTDMWARSFDPSRRGGRITGRDWLPSLSLIYRFTPTVNVRAAYGRTLARPTLREIAPYGAEEFAGSRLFLGNHNLTYTKIRNFDVRLEWFARPGEIIALGAFYKRFVNPIELSFFSTNYDIWPVNAPEATNYGVELEIRKRLDQITPRLQYFSIGGNLSLVNSQLHIPEFELLMMRGVDRSASDTRPMAYQSPYIINASIGYSNPRSGTTVDLLYNVFGRRFYYNSQGGAPDIYEKPRHSVDMTFSQKIWQRATFKASAKNLLNDNFEAVYYYTGSGREVPYRTYDIGRTVSIGMSYKVF